METYLVRLFWDITEKKKPDPGMISLACESGDSAFQKAEAIWLEYRENLTPPPVGFLVYDGKSRKIIHERRIDAPRPVAAASRAAPRGARAMFWRRRQFR